MNAWYTACMKAVWIVLDGVGIGALPDAAAYGDEGSDTLGNLSKAVGGLRLPHLESGHRQRGGRRRCQSVTCW